MAPVSSCKASKLSLLVVLLVSMLERTSQEEVASLFGKTEGFKVGEPNVITDIPESVLAWG